MIFPSLETTYRSEREGFYNSMGMENKKNFNSCNNSFECSFYRPNVGNIPLRSLKEFPFMLPTKIEDFCKKKNNNYNKFDIKNNNTFMMTSFDKLNSSINSDMQYNKHRKIKKQKINVKSY